MSSRKNYDDDDELGAYIYQTSHTAKLFREKAAFEALISTPTSHQTQRKSPRLLATKSKQQDLIPTTAVPEKSINNTNITIKERTKRKRKSAVLKEENITVKQRVKHKRKKYTCSHQGCTKLARKGGVCLRHGAKKYYCSHEGCTNIAQRSMFKTWGDTDAMQT